jgi:hypothetical protein
MIGGLFKGLAANGIKTTVAPFLGWIYAAAAALAVGALYATYDWAYDRGYDAHKRATEAAADAQRETNRLFARGNDSAATKQAQALDKGRAVTARKAQDELQKTMDALRATLPKCVPDGGSGSGVPSVPATGGIPDACAAAAATAVENYRIATENGDQVTALQAHIERSRRGYNEATKQKDERPVSDAEARWAKREKEFNERAKALEGKK